MVTVADNDQRHFGVRRQNFAHFGVIFHLRRVPVETMRILARIPLLPVVNQMCIRIDQPLAVVSFRQFIDGSSKAQTVQFPHRQSASPRFPDAPGTHDLPEVQHQPADSCDLPQMRLLHDSRGCAVGRRTGNRIISPVARDSSAFNLSPPRG